MRTPLRYEGNADLWSAVSPASSVQGSEHILVPQRFGRLPTACEVRATTRSMALMLAAFPLLVVFRAGADWTPLENRPPNNGNAGHMLLLSDATVMVQNGNSANWYRLTPTNGSYIKGGWSNIAFMSYPRANYASDVLRDGRIFVAGGEEPTNGPQQIHAEVYDPRTNGWYVTADEGGLPFKDSESVLLPDGTVLVHPLLPTNVPPTNLIYNAAQNVWTLGGTNNGRVGEATWVKLPDDSILTVDKQTTTTERYIPALNAWIPDAFAPTSLWEQAEMGAGFLLPDRRVVFFGGNGHTALYTQSPKGGTNQGSWVRGPDIPNGLAVSDAPAAMMPNGRILILVGVPHQAGSLPPTSFYEFDYTGQTMNSDGTVNPNGSFQLVVSPDNTTNAYNSRAGFNHLLDLPDGTILMASTATSQLYVYHPANPTPLTSGKPAITGVTWNSNGSLHLSGTLFNGISQGTSYGDDAQQDSNYPLVRFTDSSGNIYYGRTYNWSSTSVMTGSKIVTTEATVPAAVADSSEALSLQVIANGIASDPVTFNEPIWVDFNYSGSLQLGTYSNPYTTLSNGVSAVSKRGTIAFKANVQPSVSHETMTISKPMALISVGGPATVGRK
ncbi:MAG TPA: hypothetical protein VFE51_31435 [Verrucomicrobiae bacterium]|nr:hypothetical protein [Verrucomicrobiae bacterium]